MNSFRLHLHFNHANLTNPSLITPLIIPIKPKSKLIYATSSSSKSSHVVNSKPRRNTIHIDKLKSISFEKSSVSSSKDLSKMVLLGTMSLGMALFLMGFDDHRAMAFGPEGPLLEDFWDNMRRYALYALTVSTGALYVLLEPIIELLKNPISAILILVIIGGSFFIVSQVVTAMVGLSDFSYDYNY